MIEIARSALLEETDTGGRLRVSACYQCGKCSSGCPMHFDTDLLPHQLVRLVQLGARDEVLASRAIWACASCGTCVSRCPMGVRTPELIDVLRAMAVREGAPADRRSPAFNEAFLASVRRYGRVYEPAMLAAYKLRSGDLLGDLAKAPAMLLKRRLKLTPPRGGNLASVRRIFQGLRRRSP